ALGFTIERERQVSYSDQRSISAAEAGSAGKKYLIGPTTEFERSVDEDARLAQLSAPRWKEREDILRPVLEKVYRNPDAALTAVNSLASDAGLEPRKLADDLANA